VHETSQPGLKLVKKEQDGIQIFDLEGDLDSRSSWVAKEEIRTAIAQGQKRILINLENVPYMDSAGLGMLVSALKSARENKGGIFLASLTDQVRMVIELTRLDRVFTIFESVDRAVTELSSPNFKEPGE
jgi:anti-sigma B factor antagonist